MSLLRAMYRSAVYATFTLPITLLTTPLYKKSCMRILLNFIEVENNAYAQSRGIN